MATKTERMELARKDRGYAGQEMTNVALRMWSTFHSRFYLTPHWFELGVSALELLDAQRTAALEGRRYEIALRRDRGVFRVSSGYEPETDEIVLRAAMDWENGTAAEWRDFARLSASDPARSIDEAREREAEQVRRAKLHLHIGS